MDDNKQYILIDGKLYKKSECFYEDKIAFSKCGREGIVEGNRPEDFIKDGDLVEFKDIENDRTYVMAVEDVAYTANNGIKLYFYRLDGYIDDDFIINKIYKPCETGYDLIAERKLDEDAVIKVYNWVLR